MDTKREAHRLFVEALELEYSARPAFLDANCGAQGKLRESVEKLLAAVEESSEFLSTPAIDADCFSKPLPARRERVFAEDAIEGFRILRRLNSGGMAEVYEAQQIEPSRKVAIKILHAALVDTSAIKRFTFEAETLARLNHPNIAKIYHSGVCPDSRGNDVPFYVLELVPEARTLSEFVQDHSLPLNSSLELFVEVVEAVQYGHQAGVIHRDLKPGNILVDREGRPRVIDYGVAKATDVGVNNLTNSFDFGSIIGTLNYMSPEQCSGKAAVDSRTDVYSLGVVLYELLTNVRPFELSSSSIIEALHTVQSKSPPIPSKHVDNLPDDVSAIVMKSLAKDPDQRYATASELAADIRRFLENRPILARTPSLAYHAKMFARRNPGLVAAIACILVAMVAGIAATTRMAYVARLARNTAQARQAELEQVVQFQDTQIRHIDLEAMGQHLRDVIVKSVRDQDPDKDTLESFLGLLDQANFSSIALDSITQNVLDRSAESIREQFSEQPLVQAQLLATLAETFTELGRLDRANEVVRQALEIREQQLGLNHPATMQLQQTVVELMSNMGKLEAAEEMGRELLQRRREILGDLHPDTLRSANSYGGTLRLMGKPKQAEKVWSKNLRDRQQVLGLDHPETLVSLNNLGVIHSVMGDYSAAEADYRDLLTRIRRTRSQDDRLFLSSQGNLGLLLLDQGKLEEARPLLEDSLASLRRLRGDDHPSTLIAMGNLAELRLALEDFQTALELSDENVARRRTTFGEQHPFTLRAMVLSAEMRRRMSDNAAAVDALRNAIDLQRKTFPGGHIDLAASISELATWLNEDGLVEESEKLHQESLQLLKSLGQEDSAVHGECLRKYGSVLLEQGRWVEAVAPLKRAYQILSQSFGPSNERTQKTVEGLVHLYSQAPEIKNAADELVIWKKRLINP